MKSKFIHVIVTSLFVGFMSIGSVNSTPITFDISMVADNDFALFSGDSNGINNLLYQNNDVWWNQISALSTLNFSLAAGDDKFYILGMGGGGPEENISGMVNGVNMTSVAVSMSSDISSLLTGYNLSSVSLGSYNANLLDVQNAFSGLSWTDAALNLNSTQTVITGAGFGSGFSFSTLNAHLFSFDAVDVGVEVIPEPSSLAIYALAIIWLASRRFSK